jgi:hypothetical protein
VEDEDKEGPYNNSKIPLMKYLEKHGIIDYCDMDNSFTKYMNTHKNPEEDTLLSQPYSNLVCKSEYIFGFVTLDQVFEWFCLPEELDYLQEFGFSIVVYETEDDYIIKGKWQAIALKDSLIVRDKIDF